MVRPRQDQPCDHQCLPCGSHLPVPFRAESSHLPWPGCSMMQFFSPGGPGVRKLFHMVLVLSLLLFIITLVVVWVICFHIQYCCCITQLILYHIILSHLLTVPLRTWFLCWRMYLLELCFLFYFYFSVLLLNDWVLNWAHFPQWWSSLWMGHGRHSTYLGTLENHEDW